MFKVIRRNQKFFLVALSIAGMLTFVANRGTGGQSGGSDPDAGTIRGQKFRASELVAARVELNAVSQKLTLAGNDDVHSQWDNVVFGLSHRFKPEQFFLLRHEAMEAGIKVNDDDVQAVMSFHAIGLSHDSDEYLDAQAGVADIMRIFLRFQQIVGAVKASKPQVERQLATAEQSLNLAVVQFNAADDLPRTKAPTTQQVQEQFTRFAGDMPHHPVPTTNPLGFGYKLPVRAKLSYLLVTPDAVTAAVKDHPRLAYVVFNQLDAKTNYDKKEDRDYLWDVLGQIVFQNDPAKYAYKPPANAALIQGPPLPAGPRTYDQAKLDVLKDLQQQVAVDQMGKIRSFIDTTMNNDWQAYLKYLKLTPTDPEPAASVGVPYSSPAYMAALAAKVKTDFLVTANLAETPDFLSADAISMLPKISSPLLKTFIDSQSDQYFARLDANDKTAPAALLKPVPAPEAGSTLTDLVMSRISAVVPSQAPADVSLVRAAVEGDVRLGEAYKMAQDDAAALAAATKTSGIYIASVGKKVVPVNKLKLDSTSLPWVGILPPLEDSAADFTKQAFTLVDTYSPMMNPHPVKTIELPEQTRVFVAQLNGIDTGWKADTYYRAVLGCEYSLDNTIRQAANLDVDWFSQESVAKRLDYKPIKGK